MKVNRSTVAATLAVCFALVLARCSHTVSGVETTNGDQVTVVSTNGTLVIDGDPYAGMYLFDVNYIPLVDNGLGVAFFANAGGQFEFEDTLSVDYTVFIFNGDQSKVAVRTRSDLLTGGTVELKAPGAVRGTVALSMATRILVYLKGTGYYTLADSTGAFVLSAVAQGSYTLYAAPLSPVTGLPVVSQSVTIPLEIQSGDTTFVGEILPE